MENICSYSSGITDVSGNGTWAIGLAEPVFLSHEPSYPPQSFI